MAVSKTKPIRVLGGTGKTGRRVAARLAAQDIPTRIGSRSGQPPFDWVDRSTWAPALNGVQSVYVSYYPDLAAPGTVEADVPVSIEEHALTALEHGVAEEVVELLTYLFSEVLDGRNARLTDGVLHALGREPRDFADYARDAAATGVWDAA